MNAFSQLKNLNKETNFDNIRKEKLEQILNQPIKTEDQIIFIDNFIKHYCSAILAQLKALLSSDNYKTLLSTAKYQKYHSDQAIFVNQDQQTIDLLFVISGTLQLSSPSRSETLAPGQSILPSDSANQRINLKATSGITEILTINGNVYKQMIHQSSNHENAWKLKCLMKSFLKFKQTDNNKEILLSLFQSSGRLSFGEIVTTPTSGSKDLLICGQGKILVFTPNRYNQAYGKKFLILSILKQNNTFNESQLLFNNDEIYGTMVCEQNTELLKLSKQNLLQVTDQDTLDLLRDSCSSKYRLYKQMIDKLSNLSKDDLEQQQKQLAQAFELDFEKLEQFFQKHYQNGTIYTTEALTNKEKNLKQFNEKIGKTGLEYKGRGEVDIQKKEEVIFGTNRIVARELQGIKGMTATQQLALRNLQSIGKQRRLGQFDKDSPLKDMSQTEVQKYRNNMLNAVKDEEIQKSTVQYQFIKKEIGERKLNQKKSEEIKKKSVNKNIFDDYNDKVIIINNYKKNNNSNPVKESDSASQSRQKLLENL